jgi:hypothetical protein
MRRDWQQGSAWPAPIRLPSSSPAVAADPSRCSCCKIPIRSQTPHRIVPRPVLCFGDADRTRTRRPGWRGGRGLWTVWGAKRPPRVRVATSRQMPSLSTRPSCALPHPTTSFICLHPDDQTTATRPRSPPPPRALTAQAVHQHARRCAGTHRGHGGRASSVPPSQIDPPGDPRCRVARCPRTGCVRTNASVQQQQQHPHSLAGPPRRTAALPSP